MTTTEALSKIAFDEGFTDWDDFLDYSEGQSANLTEFIQQAMVLYAAQFIKAGEDVIGPATAILPDTYNEELDDWYEIIKINKV